jgi:RNase P/RNase MRP subunit POP5
MIILDSKGVIKMDLSLIKRPNEEKINVNLRLYSGVVKKLADFCAEENIRVTDLIRHIINDFIANNITKKEIN